MGEPLRLKMPGNPESQGLIYGLFGILIFSLTLPATRMALSSFDPTFVGLGRSIGAATLSLILLIAKRQTIPSKQYLPNFFVVVAGVIIGFPLLSAIAMQDAPASQGAVIVGLLPLFTALSGVLRAGERPPVKFWIFAGLGSALVLGFAIISGGGALRWADWALLGAVVAAGLGYAEGAVLARKLGSWQVICWALVLAAPVLLPIAWHHGPADWRSISPGALVGFLYVTVFSMFLGFFAWYHGLALGGVARVGQLQLIQPFLTIVASSLLLGEPLTLITLGFAIAVIICVALGRQAQIKT
jgi:drug/metabolite transporter (DMT)-like permease